MKKLNWLAGVLAIAFGISAQADDSPLSQVSKDADVVVRIRAFDTTVENLAALTNEVQPGAGDLVSQNATMFGLVLSNPTLAGVDRTKDFYLMLFARPEGEPKALFVIPTTDGPALQKGLPENYESQVRESWVFYATKEHGVPEAVTEADSLGAALARSESLEVLDDADIGLYVNAKHLKEVYADKIQAGREKFEQQMQKGVNAGGTENAAGTLQILKLEADCAFQVLEDTRSIAIGIGVSKEGVEFSDYFDFEEGSPVAAFLEKHPTSKFDALSKLGEGFPVYVGLSGDFHSLAEMSRPMIDAIYSDPKVQEGFKAYLATLEQTPMTSAVGSFDLASGGAGLFRTSSFFESKASAEFLEAFRKLAESMKSVTMNGVTSETAYEPEAETIGTRKVDVMTVKQQVDPKQQGAAILTMVSGVMFGPNGFQSRTTALADGLLQTQGGGKAGMEAALKAYDAKANSLTGVREEQVEEAHALLLLDLPGLVTNGLLAATSIPGIPLPIKKEAVEELQITRSYLTVSAVGEKHALRIECNVPAEQLRGVMKLVGLFQQMRGGR
ncbi:MAG: hypothetical protein U0929_11335 [Planctomycetaceae bacterium]